MNERFEKLPWWLPLLAWLPALLIAQHWPQSRLADLPFLVIPLYAAFRLWRTILRRPDQAFSISLIQAGLLWVAAVGADGLPVRVVLLAGGMALLSLVFVAHYLPRRAGRDLAQVFLAGSLFLPVLAVLHAQNAAIAPQVSVAEQAEPLQPLFFIPLECSPTGQRLAMLSLRDLDSDDDEAVSLWSLDTGSGKPTKTFQGFPYLLADWCPAGNSLAFMASDRTWLEDDETPPPFGVVAAKWDGGSTRALLPVPTDGTSWFYPQWSKQQDLIAAWRVGDRMIESWAVSADGGAPQQVKVPGCRLALFGAWQADAPSGFVLTEKGIFQVPREGKPRLLVPSGEAPMDPFPLVIPDGVDPSGKFLAYLQLLFKKGEIDRIDIGLKKLGGRQRLVMRDIYPMALAWSRDGQRLVAGTLTRNDELVLQFLDTTTGKSVAFKTGLKLASRELPIRMKFSRSGRYLAMDGQFASEEGWDVAVVDLQEMSAKVLEHATNHLFAGWNAQDKMLLCNLTSVASIEPDGTGYRPIYGQGHGQATNLDLLLTVAQIRGLASERQLAMAGEALQRVRQNAR